MALAILGRLNILNKISIFGGGVHYKIFHLAFYLMFLFFIKYPKFAVIGFERVCGPICHQ